MEEPFLFDPSNPEHIEHVRQLHIKKAMEADNYSHNWQRLVAENLDRDGLVAFRSMMHQIVIESGSNLASSFEAMAATVLYFKHGVCIPHTVNHEEEMQDELKRAAEQPQQVGEPGPSVYMPPVPPTPDEARIPGPLDEPLFNGKNEITDEDREIMKIYHLDDAYDEDTNEFVGFICTGIKGSNGPCGLKYETIGDRIMKGPEDCHGCFIRNAHG